MSSNPRIDCDSFQQFLANAYEVQASKISHESLADLMEVRRSIAARELDLNRVFDIIVRHACKVANADGIAIALLETNKLIYRAGSGKACSYIGRHQTAVLTAETGKERREILRVENADADVRIEAAICRQFDAKSLLILSIYEDRRLAGIFEIFFSGVHTFEDNEVRVYHLLAGLIEEAILRDRKALSEKVLPTETRATPQIKEVACRMPEVHAVNNPAESPEQLPGVGLCYGRSSAVEEEPLRILAQEMVQSKHGVKREIFVKSWRNLTAAMALASIVTAWVAYHAGRALPAVRLASKQPNLSSQPVSKKASTMGHTGLKQTTAITEHQRTASAFKRIQVGPNEVDYIADDVTIRHFTPKPTPSKPLNRGTRQINLGSDVTMRYFTEKSSASLQSANLPHRAEASLAPLK